MPPEVCPNCGAEIPRDAKACPECGSDEETGWSETAYASHLGLPDEDFDHDEFVKREFGPEPVKPRGIAWFWWVAALLVVAGMLLLWLNGQVRTSKIFGCCVISGFAIFLPSSNPNKKPARTSGL